MATGGDWDCDPAITCWDIVEFESTKIPTGHMKTKIPTGPMKIPI